MDLSDATILAQFFQISEDILRVESHGTGNIHTTFLFETILGKKYILQKMHPVFNHGSMMHNIALVENHLREKQHTGEWDANFRILEMLTTSDGKNYASYQRSFWRISRYIENTITYEGGITPVQAKKIGALVGTFHTCLRDISGRLSDALPGFHDTQAYYVQYLEQSGSTYKQDASLDVWIQSQEAEIATWRTFQTNTPLTKYVTHNDLKITNFLFSKETLEPIALIDWDTLSDTLPVLIDIGDLCRSLCASQSENAEHTKQFFQIDILEALMEGYFSKNPHMPTVEKKMIPFIISFITFELTLRFYTDYLRGNTYFHVSYAEQNLDRARNQYALWQSIHAQEHSILQILTKFI